MKERFISLNGEINELKAIEVIMQLLFLEHENDEEPIHLYINSNGGSITYGLAIFDTINIIKSPVYTICNGMAASMGAFLLSIGKKGHRKALKNSRILIHQPLVMGNTSLLTESKLRKLSKNLNTKRNLLEEIMAKACSKDQKVLNKDCERDNWMSAEEALQYGLIDELI